MSGWLFGEANKEGRKNGGGQVKREEAEKGEEETGEVLKEQDLGAGDVINCHPRMGWLYPL